MVKWTRIKHAKGWADEASNGWQDAVTPTDPETGRHSCIVTFAFLAVALVGCGGTQIPTGYSCGDVTRKHCYAKATLGDHITGFTARIGVADGISPGDGFVTNELWLNNYTGVSSWIEVGYQQNSVERLHYFWAMNDENGVFTKESIADVPAQEKSTSVYFDVHQIAPDSFRVSVQGSATHFTKVIAVHLWNGSSGGYAGVGQELAGTSGASAPNAQFTDMATYTNGTRSPVTAVSLVVDQPPNAGWLSSRPLRTPVVR